MEEEKNWWIFILIMDKKRPFLPSVRPMRKRPRQQGVVQQLRNAFLDDF